MLQSKFENMNEVDKRAYESNMRELNIIEGRKFIISPPIERVDIPLWLHLHFS